ncbi:hypothetical protein RRG08_020123 [Elysia crispata]|uniref:Uncharacterized protein n=1 Tax=Elysia crispata TaxID=231223 RepID=A0AAE1DSF1_9GAST|nr:hypothetical protein RRG08_020123 [Elysia crispata]
MSTAGIERRDTILKLSETRADNLYADGPRPLLLELSSPRLLLEPDVGPPGLPGDAGILPPADDQTVRALLNPLGPVLPRGVLLQFYFLPVPHINHRSSMEFSEDSIEKFNLKFGKQGGKLTQGLRACGRSFC